MIHVLERVASPPIRDSGIWNDDYGTERPEDCYTKNGSIDDPSEDKLEFGTHDRYYPL